MNRAWMQAIVPREWTGEQALFVAGALNAALDAIWQVHGEEMAYALGDRPGSEWDEILRQTEDLDDDIPF